MVDGIAIGGGSIVTLAGLSWIIYQRLKPEIESRDAAVEQRQR